MYKPELISVIQLMRRCIDNMQKEGAVRPRGGKIVLLREVFPFQPDDVAGVYTEGGPNSVRFRLKDGRSFDDRGKPVSPPKES